MTTCTSPVAAVVAVLAVGCGSSSDRTSAASCPPLAVTVDGTALAAMPHGLARSNTLNGDVSLEVQVFNHDTTTCADLLNKRGRTIPDGEVSVRAFAGGKGMFGQGVAIEAHTQAGGDVTLVSARPRKPGDVVKLCARNISFEPTIGSYKDRPVTMNGLFEGTYCGEMKF